jgi:signal transduction histidine kinase
VGIPEPEIDSVFDPYFTTKAGGTGLGLAIVQRILFDHGGNVWAESDGSRGTTFFVDLPAVVPPAPSDPAVPAASPSPAASNPPESRTHE